MTEVRQEREGGQAESGEFDSQWLEIHGDSENSCHQPARTHSELSELHLELKKPLTDSADEGVG